MSKEQKEISSLSYEQALAELEAIIDAIEGTSANLDAAVTLFEKGKQLIKHCQELLDNASIKINILTESGTQESLGDEDD